MKKFITGMLVGALGSALYKERKYLKSCYKYGVARGEAGQPPNVKEIWEDVERIWDDQHK